MAERAINHPVKNVNNVCGHYAHINGLNMYYEVHGTGRPLVLIHGGVGASEMFSPILPSLAEHMQVITPHLQAHGRTADIDRPIRYETMADGIAALMKYLGIGRADIIGYSLGGGVALQIAIRHPDVVRKLVVISAPAKLDGWYPDVLQRIARMRHKTAKTMERSPLNQLYPNIDWDVLFKKLGDLSMQDYDWTKDVAAVKAPMMIVFADADAVRTAHITEFFSLLGGGQRNAGLDGSLRPEAWLAVLPGMTHYNVISFPGLAELIMRFLDDNADTTI